MEPAKGETPYSSNPGRTQSACASEKLNMAAEFAMLRSPGRERVAASNTRQLFRGGRQSRVVRGGQMREQVHRRPAPPAGAQRRMRGAETPRL